MRGIRRKEDPYNAIIAGFFTGGSLAVRGGFRAMRNGTVPPEQSETRLLRRNRCDRMRHPARCHRRRRHRIPTDDGREHEVGCSTDACSGGRRRESFSMTSSGNGRVFEWILAVVVNQEKQKSICVVRYWTRDRVSVRGIVKDWSVYPSIMVSWHCRIIPV